MKTILDYIESQEGRESSHGGKRAAGDGYSSSPDYRHGIQGAPRAGEVFGPVLAVIKAKNYDTHWKSPTTPSRPDRAVYPKIPKKSARPRSLHVGIY